MQPWDQALQRAAQNDGVVDFKNDSPQHQENQEEKPSKPELDAALFLKVIAGEEVAAPLEDGSPEPRPRGPNPCLRWRICGATFSGLIDLSDRCGGAAGALPTLEFEDCTFPAGFRAEHTVIRRLSFVRCSFGLAPDSNLMEWSISLRNAQIRGDVLLDTVLSTRDDGLLSLLGFGVAVVGNLRIMNSRFKAPPDRRTFGHELPHYALEFSGAEIRNDLRLYPKVAAHGGLRVKGAHIGGDFAAFDLELDDGFGSDDPQAKQHRIDFFESKLPAREALAATSCRIDNNLFLSALPKLAPFRATGACGCYGIHIGGTAMMGGAIFNNGGLGYALLLNSGKIEGDLLAYSDEQPGGHDLRVTGPAAFMGLAVQGRVELHGTFTEIDAAGMRVAGNTNLAVKVQSTLNLGGADLKGELDLSRFSFWDNPTLSSQGQRPRTATSAESFSFSLRDADIGHTLFLASTTALEPGIPRVTRWQPDCLPRHKLFQIELFEQGKAYILLQDGRAPTLLDGFSAPIHALSQRGFLVLDSDDQIKDYIRFFCAFVWGDDGPFVVVEEAKNLGQVPEGSLPNLSEDMQGRIAEMQIEYKLSDLDQEHLFAQMGISSEETKTREELKQLIEDRRVALARTHVRYGAHLYRAVFAVLTKPLASKGLNVGFITMLEDQAIAEFDATKLPAYNRPFTRGRPFSPPEYAPKPPAEPFTEIELTLRIPSWREQLQRPLVGFQKASIDLSNATCRVLEDADGRAWGPDLEKNLRLENFRYESVGTPLANRTALTRKAHLLLFLTRKNDRIPPGFLNPAHRAWWITEKPRAAKKQRLSWLARMGNKEFVPQPYAQLAKVMNASGEIAIADAITAKKTDLEVRATARKSTEELYERPLPIYLKLPLMFGYRIIMLGYRMIWGLFRFFFNYGLSGLRATLTWIAFLLAGWGGTHVLNAGGYLVQNTTPSATILVKGEDGRLAPAFPPAGKDGYSGDIGCKQSINELLYAVDVFIPLLDLKQESRCDVRSFDKGDVNPDRAWDSKQVPIARLGAYLWSVFHSPLWWAQAGKASYAILGWIVISLTILTYSGMRRRSGEE